MTDQEKEVSDPLEVEWYAAGLEAWYATRLEQDKSLLTLSAGGIGLLITLVSTVGIPSLETLILFVLALVAFIVCLASVLWIFRRNSTYIRDAVHRGANNDPLLAVLDNVAISTFIAGVVLSGIIGITAATRSLESKGTNMANKNSTTDFVAVGDSVNGVLGMKPGQATPGRSFNGVGSMAPTASSSAAKSQTAQIQPAQVTLPAAASSSTKTK